MTLQEFLRAVHTVSEDDLRLAMTCALSAGAPRSHSEYAAFYARVVAELKAGCPTLDHKAVA